MTDLLPCPFCGGTELRPRQDLVAYVRAFSWIVLCRCGACGSNQPTRDEAIAAWNTRAEATRTPPDDVVDYVYRYGGRCRDCADYNGVCPAKGLPCDPDMAAKATRHVLAAISYREAIALQASDNRLVDGWQPIETAPRDGSFILAWQEDVSLPDMVVISFDEDWGRDGWWMVCDGKNPELPLRGPEPKCWMPLPETPAALKDVGR